MHVFSTLVTSSHLRNQAPPFTEYRKKGVSPSHFLRDPNFDVITTTKWLLIKPQKTMVKKIFALFSLAKMGNGRTYLLWSIFSWAPQRKISSKNN